ncbi:FGGY-family carbohydrate kinase [Hoyosella altamirensis]|uniref:Sugar (Pentulose or hexulose) kinase n=1 Tax=Hoyosella altamirensis TaxID=616997 RepID=A0A839RK31_9ACTN|nr:FGGY family carbohydrate kinase [Hoyosella altamirensis]MBB3036534.1 sugar (pentulose or hexulose) kinase [Hoyosella altamirensis]
MSDEVWLGIDVGTQSVRCIAMTAEGRIAGSGAHPLTSNRSGDRHEQEPESWWEALATASRAALAQSDVTVRGVALDATSGSIVMTDRAGKPVTPGLMYDDARATDESVRVQEAGDDLWRSLGYRPQASWALPKLLWLYRHGDLPEGAVLQHQADYLTSLLVGRATAADSSHALKTGYDLEHERWPVDLIDTLGLPVSVLPDVVRPGTELGVVGTAAADATGIPAGTPVKAGMTDGCAALLGSGTVGVGSWNAVLGTTLVLKGVTEQRIRDPLGVVYSHRAPDGNWLPGGASSAGAGVLSAEFPGADLDALSAKAAERDGRAFTYPVVSQGERFPFVAPELRRFTIGEVADDIDYYASLLRGVAYVERLCFDYLDLLGAPTHGTLSVTGGGARSSYWNQLRADVLQRTIVVPEHADAATGMAILARAGTGSLADAANGIERRTTTFDPRGDQATLHDDTYLTLIAELHKRGWLPDSVARHAQNRRNR